RILTPGTHRLARIVVEIGGEPGLIDVYVVGAGRDEAVDDRPPYVDDVVDYLVDRGVGGARIADGESRGDPVGPDDRDLYGPLGEAGNEAVLLQRLVLEQAKALRR